MNLNKQFFWFLMNAVLMCIFIVPVAVAFWLSAFAAGFDWSQWVKLAADTLQVTRPRLWARFRPTGAFSASSCWRRTV